MYQALYRKYRSQRFSEIVGQEVVATSLKQSVKNHKISHAYLFSGPRGTGKTSAAKIFAKAMNCPNQVDGEPCNNCYICQSITAGSLEDVIEIDAASNNGVDEVRDIRDKSTYAPSLAQHKVYIIDEVHMLSTGAFNALLKTLEEPTKGVVFILATTELHKIPATILSRVQRFEFKAIKSLDIVAHLEDILEKERVTFDPSALSLIARCAEGGMRDALSTLDQVLSLSTGQSISLETVEEVTGSTSLSAMDDYVSYIISYDVAQALDCLQTIKDSGKKMSRFVVDLLNYFRDLLLVKNGGTIPQQSERFQTNLTVDQDRLFQMIDFATLGLQNIKQSSQSHIYADMMTIQLGEHSIETKQIDQKVMSELTDLRQEVEQLKKEIAEGLSQSISQGKGRNQKQSKLYSKQSYQIDKEKVMSVLQEAMDNPEQSRQNLIRLQESWGEILENLSQPSRSLLETSKPLAANEHHAILGFDASFTAEQVMKRDNINTIFGNTLSQTVGFSPDLIAIPLADWSRLRAEFKAQFSSDDSQIEQAEDTTIPTGFEFLKDKIVSSEK